jgi:SulP family sulfate permease
MRFPMFGGLWPIRPRDALRDAFAGLTLASMSIPQILGYTRIAGTPVVTGLYTVLLPLVAFALFGSSRHLVVAADSATAAILRVRCRAWPNRLVPITWRSLVWSRC